MKKITNLQVNKNEVFMYCQIQSFIDDYKQESEKTLQIFKALSNESLSVKVYQEGRDIETIARHIIFTISDMFKYLNINIEVIEKNEKLKSVEEIATKYQIAVQQLLSGISEKLKDEMLEDEIEIYGEHWKIKNVLYSFLKHEIHHRAQLAVLMRQAGLVIPGIYGPSKEEWKDYGMEPEE